MNLIQLYFIELIVSHNDEFPLCFAVSCRYVMLLLILFAIPGVVMIIAYGLISRELYRGIRFEMGQKKDSTGELMHRKTTKDMEIDARNLHDLCKIILTLCFFHKPLGRLLKMGNEEQNYVCIF